MIKQSLFALGTGALVGFLFAKLKLPSPAPASVVGVIGILGVVIGAYIAKVL